MLELFAKCPMSRQALKKIIKKFEETGYLHVIRGRERISNETVEKVAYASFERLFTVPSILL